MTKNNCLSEIGYPPEFLALVFEPEFMNSAGKEVLMDMAEQRHFLPVYRLDSVFQDQHELDRQKQWVRTLK